MNHYIWINTMKLNPATGNMYDFIDYTGNAIRGNCPHNCKYCYMNQYGYLGNIRLDEKELTGKMKNKKTGEVIENKFIFIGDSIDMFADKIPAEWIKAVLDYCDCFNNKYLFQSKNPKRILEFINHSVFSKSVVCTTIESNFDYPLMNNSPKIIDRVLAMEKISNTQIIPYQQDLFDTTILIPRNIETYVTIEPIMKFDLPILVDYIKRCNPTQVNIGANSKEYRIISFREDEPSYDEVIELINELSKFTKVVLKDNLKRLRKC